MNPSGLPNHGCPSSNKIHNFAVCSTFSSSSRANNSSSCNLQNSNNNSFASSSALNASLSLQSVDSPSHSQHCNSDNIGSLKGIVSGLVKEEENHVSKESLRLTSEKEKLAPSVEDMESAPLLSNCFQSIDTTRDLLCFSNASTICKDSTTLSDLSSITCFGSKSVNDPVIDKPASMSDDASPCCYALEPLSSYGSQCGCAPFLCKKHSSSIHSLSSTNAIGIEKTHNRVTESKTSSFTNHGDIFNALDSQEDPLETPHKSSMVNPFGSTLSCYFTNREPEDLNYHLSNSSLPSSDVFPFSLHQGSLSEPPRHISFCLPKHDSGSSPQSLSLEDFSVPHLSCTRTPSEPSQRNCSTQQIGYASKTNESMRKDQKGSCLSEFPPCPGVVWEDSKTSSVSTTSVSLPCSRQGTPTSKECKSPNVSHTRVRHLSIDSTNHFESSCSTSGSVSQYQSISQSHSSAALQRIVEDTSSRDSASIVKWGSPSLYGEAPSHISSASERCLAIVASDNSSLGCQRIGLELGSIHPTRTCYEGFNGWLKDNHQLLEENVTDGNGTQDSIDFALKDLTSTFGLTSGTFTSDPSNVESLAKHFSSVELLKLKKLLGPSTLHSQSNNTISSQTTDKFGNELGLKILKSLESITTDTVEGSSQSSVNGDNRTDSRSPNLKTPLSSHRSLSSDFSYRLTNETTDTMLLSHLSPLTTVSSEESIHSLTPSTPTKSTLPRVSGSTMCSPLGAETITQSEEHTAVNPVTLMRPSALPTPSSTNDMSKSDKLLQAVNETVTVQGLPKTMATGHHVHAVPDHCLLQVSNQHPSLGPVKPLNDWRTISWSANEKHSASSQRQTRNDVSLNSLNITSSLSVSNPQWHRDTTSTDIMMSRDQHHPNMVKHLNPLILHPSEVRPSPIAPLPHQSSLSQSSLSLSPSVSMPSPAQSALSCSPNNIQRRIPSSDAPISPLSSPLSELSPSSCSTPDLPSGHSYLRGTKHSCLAYRPTSIATPEAALFRGYETTKQWHVQMPAVYNSNSSNAPPRIQHQLQSQLRSQTVQKSQLPNLLTPVTSIQTSNQLPILTHMGYTQQIKQEDTAAVFANQTEELTGRVVSLAKVQSGSRFLQRLLSKGHPESVTLILEEIHDRITELMIDPYGNYLCQQLFEVCSPDQRRLILQTLAPRAVEISCDRRGTHSMQALISMMNSKEEAMLLMNELEGHVLQLSIHPHGTHVIQRTLSVFEEPSIDSIFDPITRNLDEVARHPHGLCVVKKCITAASKEGSRHANSFLQQLSTLAIGLIQSPYGNYAIQHALESWGPIRCKPILQQVKASLVILSTQKFSSNVVEKTIEIALHDDLREIIHDLSQPSTMGVLVNSSYGNFVVQKALDKATDEEVELLFWSLSRTTKAIQNKRLKAKWDRIVQSISQRLSSWSRQLRLTGFECSNLNSTSLETDPDNCKRVHTSTFQDGFIKERSDRDCSLTSGSTAIGQKELICVEKQSKIVEEIPVKQHQVPVNEQHYHHENETVISKEDSYERSTSLNGNVKKTSRRNNTNYQSQNNRNPPPLSNVVQTRKQQPERDCEKDQNEGKGMKTNNITASHGNLEILKNATSLTIQQQTLSRRHRRPKHHWHQHTNNGKQHQRIATHDYNTQPNITTHNSHKCNNTDNITAS